MIQTCTDVLELKGFRHRFKMGILIYYKVRNFILLHWVGIKERQFVKDYSSAELCCANLLEVAYKLFNGRAPGNHVRGFAQRSQF